MEDALSVRPQFAAVVMAATLACSAPPQVRVSVLPGSTVRTLRLQLRANGSEPKVRAIRVARSRLAGGRYAGDQGHLLWVLMPSGAHELPMPHAITYGLPPAGFTGSPAEPLGPGKYEIEVVVGGVSSLSYFDVATDGTIAS